MKDIFTYFEEGFDQALASRQTSERRLGAEMKFPLVNTDGSAVDEEMVERLWQYLELRGWSPDTDSMTGCVVGASKAGELNDTVAGCETGYCKTEFSLAHVGSLFELDKQIGWLRNELREFCEKNTVRFLSYGIHPVTPPSKKLMMKKGRTSPWTKVFGSNRHIPADAGDDVHLFTVNAATHTHVSVSKAEAIDAVNVLNGFTAAQIALTAHSNVWKGTLDAEHKCVCEAFWDWWLGQTGRVGIPEKRFENLADYVKMVSSFKPVYVKRAGKPIILKEYDSFAEYYGAPRAVGIDDKGRDVSIEPDVKDIELHNSCYWFDARISQYYTVENRANDQQKPDELLNVPALTLGLISNLGEAKNEIDRHDWTDLRAARKTAYREGLTGPFNGTTLSAFAQRMLEIAEEGLRRRGLGEERFLDPLKARVESGESPADETEALFRSGGIEALLDARTL